MQYKNAYRKIINDLQNTRLQAEEKHKTYRAEIFAKYPRLSEIEDELSAIGVTLVKLALGGNIPEIKKLQALTENLKAERQSILTKNETPKSINKFYEPPFACKKCADTGFTANKQGTADACTCLKQRLVNEYYSLSNINEVLKRENFAAFDIRLFSDEIIPSEGLSSRMNMERNFKLANDFIKNFDTDFQNLLFFGEAGLGKTFLCHCIAEDLLNSGRTVLYITVPRFCKHIEDARFNRDYSDEPAEILSAADEVDLLILDDLGAEMATIVTSSALFDILNQRLLTRKPTVISTNLSPSELAQQYSERIFSRFVGNYQMLKFFGDDIRVKKKFGNKRI